MIPQVRPEHETATEGLASREPGNEVTEAGYVYIPEDTGREGIERGEAKPEHETATEP